MKEWNRQAEWSVLSGDLRCQSVAQQATSTVSPKGFGQSMGGFAER